MVQPLLSIITVTKNNAAGLKLTAKSMAVQQQPPQIEWLIIDGASIDNSRDIIQDYLNDHTQFISEPDNGLYDAMNKGIDRAAGKYLWFLNAGDCLPDAYTLRDVAKEIRNNVGPDFIYGDARENGIIKRAHDADKFLWGMFTHHQAMLYRRDRMAELRYDPEYSLAADYAFTLQMLARANRVYYYKKVLCDYQSGGLSELHAQQARHENFLIRRDLMQLNNFKNKSIYFLNGFTLWLKRNLPFAYRTARIFSRK